MQDQQSTSGRSCGSCTACCQGWLAATIEGQRMHPGKPCQHLAGDSGCGIYARRPENPCRIFRCGWLDHPELLEDDLRPDRCGAISILGQNWQGWDVIRLVPMARQVPEDTLERFKAMARETGRPLVIGVRLIEDGRYVGVRQLGYGPPAFREAVQELITSEDILMVEPQSRDGAASPKSTAD